MDNCAPFYNTCRHRGTRLVTNTQGQFAGCRIQCPYHLWSYNCHGELVSAPRMDDHATFQTSDWPLVPVAIDHWQGFLWVNLADQPAPLTEVFAAFWTRLDPWQTSQLRVVHAEVYDLHSNWKLVLENFSECYHCPSVHPGLPELSPPRTATNDFTDGRFLGGPMQLTQQSMTTNGRRCCEPLSTLDAADRQRTLLLHVAAQSVVGLHPDFVIAWQIDPLSPAQTRITCRWLFAAEAIDAPGFDPTPAIDSGTGRTAKTGRFASRVMPASAHPAIAPAPSPPTNRSCKRSTGKSSPCWVTSLRVHTPANRNSSMARP